MKKQKMNKMVEICMENKAYRDNYQKMPQDQNKISVTFLKNKEDNMKDSEIDLFIEWFSNQRFQRRNKITLII
jgi:hypothetical protein